MYTRTKDKSGKPIFGVRGGGLYTRRGLHSGGETLPSISSLPNSIFFLLLQYESLIFAFFTSCKTGNMFRVDNKDTRIHKVNIKVKNKDIVEVVLATLSLTLRTFHFLLQCFYCWLWSVTCWLGLLFVNLMLCLLESIWTNFPLMQKLGK